MNQILTFQLDSISLNAGAPENSGISRKCPQIQEALEIHGVLQFSLSNLPAQARANLSAILEEKANPYQQSNSWLYHERGLHFDRGRELIHFFGERSSVLPVPGETPSDSPCP